MEMWAVLFQGDCVKNIRPSSDAVFSFLSFFLESRRDRMGGGAEGERESYAGSRLSVEPDAVLGLTTLRS